MSNTTSRHKCIISGCDGLAKIGRYRLKDGTIQICQLKTCGRHRNDGDFYPSYTNGSNRVKNWRNNGMTFTIEEYDKLLTQQSGRCVFCGKHWSETGKRLALDHNHQTGKIRGLLCFKCNTYLGWFESYSKSILDYLHK